jgi:malonyl-CoA O-methyltransferase
MAERLPVIKLQPRRLLQWSAFLGGSDAALKAIYPEAEQVRVEPTPELLERSLAAGKRGWLQAMLRRRPVQTLAPSAISGTASVDLVWANMGLHADADIPRTLAQWHDALAVDGFLMFSCFGPDSFIELKKIYAAQGWGRPATEWWDMHDLGDLLIEAGFADPVMDQDRISLTWADAESLLKDLQALGGNAAPERFDGCRGKAWRASLLEALEGLRDSDGRLRLSLELVYGHAFKAAPKLQLNAETHVSLEQMRSMVRQAGKQ